MEGLRIGRVGESIACEIEENRFADECQAVMRASQESSRSAACRKITDEITVGLGVTHPHTTCLLPSWEGQVTVARDTITLSRLELV